MTCSHCGMPFEASVAEASIASGRCLRCEGPDGTLAPFEEVRGRLVEAIVQAQGMDRAAAAATAAVLMARLPDWQEAMLPSAPIGGNRLVVRCDAAGLVLRGDPALTSPILREGNGQVELVETPDGWLLWPIGDALEAGWERKRSLIDLIKSVTWWNRSDIEVEVPTSVTEIDFQMLASDVDVSGIPARVTGRLKADDLDLRGITGIDLDLWTWDLDVSGCFAQGEHRIRGVAGDVDVVLEPGSDVRIEVGGQVGDANLRGLTPGHGVGSGRGARYRGQLGEGAALLRIEMTAGAVEVVAPT